MSSLKASVYKPGVNNPDPETKTKVRQNQVKHAGDETVLLISLTMTMIISVETIMSAREAAEEIPVCKSDSTAAKANKELGKQCHLVQIFSLI